MSLVRALGRSALRLFASVRGALALLFSAVRSMPKLEWRLLMQELFNAGNRSLFFVACIMAFTGAIMVIQACVQGQKIIGDLSSIGPVFMQLLVREFGPSIVALMVAARYGAGIAAELGAMRITEQVDALRMTGAEPASYLVLPRLCAGVVGMPALAVFGTLVAFVVGGVVARYGFAVALDNYFRTAFVDFGDVAVGLVKALAFGLAVPLWASFEGLRASGGAPGVGVATTRAVIGSSVLVLFLDLVIGAFAHLLEAGVGLL